MYSLWWNVHTLSISSWYPPKFRCASLSSLTDSVIQTSSPILTRVEDVILDRSWIILGSITIMIVLQAIRSNHIIPLVSSSVYIVGSTCRFTVICFNPWKLFLHLHVFKRFTEQFVDAIESWKDIKQHKVYITVYIYTRNRSYWAKHIYKLINAL